MRKPKRAVAHYRMKLKGIHKLNRKLKLSKRDKAESYFSQHWREYLGEGASS